MSRPGRGQVAVQERLEVPVGRRQPGRFLDLEDELAGGGPVGARADDDEVACLGESRRDGLGARRVLGASPPASRSTATASTGRPDRCAPTAVAATIGLR